VRSATNDTALIPQLNPDWLTALQVAGICLTSLKPIGALVEGLDLGAPNPPPPFVVEILELIMAERGFVVLRSDKALGAKAYGCTWA